MATPRKRNSELTAKPEEPAPEVVEVSELVEELAAELFETISLTEEEVVEETPEPAPPAPPVHVIRAVEPAPLKAPPKRHPRNVPKFSNSK